MSMRSLVLHEGAPSRTPGLVTRLARRAVFSLGAALQEGSLQLVEAGEKHRFGAREAELAATLRVHDPSFYPAVAFGGTIGAAESFVDGAWSTDRLVDLIRIFLRNERALRDVDGGLSRVSQPLHRLYHALRRNTEQGSRENIASHYDLGNELYALFLDETLSYSSAIFERDDMTLHEASVAKNERICRKLGLRPDHHLLEIGTGWGGFALHAATEHGCRVTTTTISRRQYDLATRRVAEAGLSDRVTVLLRDYRALTGRFDRVVSVEMIEAVGHEFYDAYFQQVSERLAPDGAALIQAITIADQQYEASKDAVDFIKRYVFPGSCIPSVTALLAASTRASELRLVHLEDITAHYARTLALWRERFLSALDGVRRLGHDERFIRSWEYYLAYCEAGFRERYIGDVQLLFAKPGFRGALPLGAL